VAAVALTVATLAPGAGTSPRPANPITVDLSARTVLLAAAHRAESAPTDGTYWHVRTTSRYTWPEKFGHGDDLYTLEHRLVVEKWAERDGQAWWGTRDWVRPKTQEDEAAWRRDGSPSKWCTGQTDTDPPQPICLYTAPGTASVTRDYHAFVVAEGRELTFEQLQQLPQDPEALRAWVVDATVEDLAPSASADIVDFNVAEILTNLLVDVPVPPGVRAAAYRALADMPNVTSTGSTQDALGREGVGIVIGGGDMTGIAVSSGGRFSAGEFTRKLIIDPETSQVLADQASVGNSSDRSSEKLVLEDGWTDEAPHEPTLP
jgi:hypothetical protein